MPIEGQAPAKDPVVSKKSSPPLRQPVRRKMAIGGRARPGRLPGIVGAGGEQRQSWVGTRRDLAHGGVGTRSHTADGKSRRVASREMLLGIRPEHVRLSHSHVDKWLQTKAADWPHDYMKVR